MRYLNYPNTTIKRILIISFVLTIIGFLIYLNTLHSQFITEWDDSAYVVNNTLIRSLNWDSIYRIFTTPYYADYYPLTILSYALDYRIWQLNPFGYHLTNLGLHIINTVLVYLFVHLLIDKHTSYRVGDREAISAFSALIFLTHPTAVESVAWIAERKNLLSMTFFLMAFYCYASYKVTERRFFYYSSIIIFSLALLSKASVVVFPILITFYDYLFCWKKEYGKKSLFADKVQFFLLAAAFSLLTILTQSNVGAIYDYPDGKPLYTFYTMLKIIVTYIRNSFLPVNLSPFYTSTISVSMFEPPVLASASTILIILATIIHLWRYKHRLLLFCIAFYFIPLLPVLHIVPIAVYITDRYLYFPMIGYSLMVALALQELLERCRKGPVFHVYILVSMVTVCFFAFLTIKQGRVWEDGITVWTKVVKENPNHAAGYLTLATSYIGENNYLKAYAYATKALELGLTDKERKDAHYFRAIALIFHGDLTRGERELERLRDIDPKFPMLFYGFGILYAKKGESENAIEYISKFLELYEPPYSNFEDLLIKDANTMLQKITPKIIEYHGKRSK